MDRLADEQLRGSQLRRYAALTEGISCMTSFELDVSQLHVFFHDDALLYAGLMA